ncbi:helix-turn-helix domain-containing protein [Nocardia abscessus]|uniref:helix-turn-helix domain-containing protein n=1 Tax=Nocardia abscessus TaxID=120957 RepID=UPI002455329A|nr:helix-turn-helix domain-containing protein [Nocardia abscessus]
MQKITKTSKQPVGMRRAIVVMASAQRQPAPAIARLMQVSEAHVRQVIHDFNERGFGPKMERGQAAEGRSSDA